MLGPFQPSARADGVRILPSPLSGNSPSLTRSRSAVATFTAFSPSPVRSVWQEPPLPSMSPSTIFHHPLRPGGNPHACSELNAMCLQRHGLEQASLYLGSVGTARSLTRDII